MLKNKIKQDEFCIILLLPPTDSAFLLGWLLEKKNSVCLSFTLGEYYFCNICLKTTYEKQPSG